MQPRSLIALALFAAAALGRSLGEDPVAPNAHERVICSLPTETTLYMNATPAVAFAKDGSRVAFVVRSPGKRGVESVPIFTELNRKGELELVVGDGYSFATTPAISDDTEHVAFVVGEAVGTKEESWRLLLDGKTYRKDDWIGAPEFWPGSDDLVFWTQPKVQRSSNGAQRGDCVLRVNKKGGAAWTWAETNRPMAFSADGERAAAITKDGEQTGIVFISPKRQKHTAIELYMPEQLALNHDGRVWALEESRTTAAEGDVDFARELRKVLRVGKSRVGEEYHSAEQPRFAPTGERLACMVAELDRRGVWLVGGAEPVFDFVDIEEIVWERGAPGREGLAFVGRLESEVTAERVAVFAMNAAGELLDGGPEWQAVRGLVVGPGGVAERDFVFAGRKAGRWHLVRTRLVDGQLATTQSAALDFVDRPVLTETGCAAGGVRGSEFIWLTLD